MLKARALWRRARTDAGSSIWLITSSAATNALGLMTLLILRATLSIQDFDQYALAFTVANLLGTAGLLGLGQYLPRHGAGLARPEAARVAFAAAKIVALWGAILVLALTIVTLLMDLSRDDVFLFTLLGVGAILGNLVTVSQGYFRSQLSMFGFRAPHLLRAALVAAAVAVFWWRDELSLSGIAAASIMTGAAALTVGATMAGPAAIRSREAIPVSELIGWLRISIPMASTTLTRTLARRTDILLLAAFAQDGAGDYLLTARVAELLSYVSVVAAARLVPQLSTAQRNGVLGRDGPDAIRRSAIASLAVVAPVLFGSIFLWVVAVGNPRMAGVFAVLLGAHLVRIVFGSVGDVAGAINLQTYALKIAVVGLVANAVFGVALIPVFGALGAALGTLVATTLWSTLVFRKIWLATGLSIGLLSFLQRPHTEREGAERP